MFCLYIEIEDEEFAYDYSNLPNLPVHTVYQVLDKKIVVT